LLGLLLHADWDWFIAQWWRQLFKAWWPSGYTLYSPSSAAADVSNWDLSSTQAVVWFVQKYFQGKEFQTQICDSKFQISNFKSQISNFNCTFKFTCILGGFFLCLRLKAILFRSPVSNSIPVLWHSIQAKSGQNAQGTSS
jgi:hypothetical protein